jgi:AcrR family transcriptional regulator
VAEANKRSAGQKKERIRETAIDHFGRHGYEETKWADIAAAVGVGPTALYHYYESKRHCLFEIMVDAVNAFRARFERTTCGDHWAAAFISFLSDEFELTDQEIMRLRVLVAYYGRSITATPALPREEAARAALRSATRELEWAWETFLTRGMQTGTIPHADPRLLTRALLGLYNSVWQWYRPDGLVPLNHVRDFIVRRQLAIVGLSEDAARAPS